MRRSGVERSARRRPRCWMLRLSSRRRLPGTPPAAAEEEEEEGAAASHIARHRISQIHCRTLYVSQTRGFQAARAHAAGPEGAAVGATRWAAHGAAARPAR